MKLDINPLMEAIDRYLAKADEDLEKTLAEEGFVEAAAAVQAVGRIEDAVVDLTQHHFDEVIEMISTEEGLKEFAHMTIPEYKSIKELQDDLQRIFRNEFDKMVRQFAFSYLVAQDPGLDFTDHRIAQQTQNTITEWSRFLAGTTTKWVEPKILQTIHEAVSAGEDVEGVTKILFESGVRDTEWKARRLALTEVLRMESIGQQDSFIQNPSCYKKRWVYTWQAADPRENHIAMNGQEVFKRDPFTLSGPNGIFYPMYPRDSNLPAGESINCHCTMSEVVDKDVLGMSEDERAELRRQALEEADAEWQKEHEHDTVDMYKSMTEEQQLRYFGGKSKGQPYKSLIDSGVITTDDQLKAMYTYPEQGPRILKGLPELRADGIFTVGDKTLEHSVKGDWSNLKNPKKPEGGANGGNMRRGGHAHGTIDTLKSKGIAYEIKKTYPNGVSIGGYAGAEAPEKRLGGSGMSWFPETWDDKKIRDAGTAVANKYGTMQEIRKPDGSFDCYMLFGNYEGVTVGVITGADRDPQTIFPDTLQRLIGGLDDD